jgi:hypothetical protein
MWPRSASILILNIQHWEFQPQLRVPAISMQLQVREVHRRYMCTAVAQGAGSFLELTGLCGFIMLQDPGLSQLPLEGFAEGAEAALDPDTAPSSPRPTASAAAGSVDADIAAASMYAESEAAGSSAGSGKRPKGSKGAGGGISNSRQREEDYFGVCHTDVVKCIVITDNGKIFTAGYVALPAPAAPQQQGVHHVALHLCHRVLQLCTRPMHTAN